MCSWCWGFRPVWLAVNASLPDGVECRYVLGGLAADTDAAMPAPMQARIRATWLQIQKEIPGTQFNFRFWEQCKPRRSTYASCRAVIAAEQQHESAGIRMLLAIQQAYYLQARNPSDIEVLIDLADGIGLHRNTFADALCSELVENKLNADFALRDRLGVHSFPGLVLGHQRRLEPIPIDYLNPAGILSRITVEIARNQGWIPTLC